MQKEACGCAEHARDGGVIPVTGFPRVDGMENEEELAMTIRTRCKHEHLIQHTNIRSWAVVSGLYLRSMRFRSGSSRRGK